MTTCHTVWLEEAKGDVSFLCPSCASQIHIGKKHMYSPKLKCGACHETVDNPIGTVPVKIKVVVPDDWDLLDDVSD